MIHEAAIPIAETSVSSGWIADLQQSRTITSRHRLESRPGLSTRTSSSGTPRHESSGEPSSGLGPNGGRNDRLRGPDLAGLDGEIAGLVDRSTQELRRAWRTLHHTGPPLGLSRDLIIRGLADKLQQHAYGGPSRTLRRRLQILAGDFEKGVRSLDPGMALKTGATLVRQWSKGFRRPRPRSTGSGSQVRS
jgi:Protein of unknown function (DUF2924)